MKIIGILGGMSAVSTQIYYDQLCRLTADKYGGLHSPELLIRSLDFAKIEVMQRQGDWRSMGYLLNREAKKLEVAGADILLLATNTMHKIDKQMMAGLSIPLLHIADATAEAICAAQLSKPALIATAFTMEQDFYINKLREAGLTPIIPDSEQRAEIHQIIFNELCCNIINPKSQQRFIDIVAELADRGADCLILGCTEVCMLLNQDNVHIPVFDTTAIHCQKAIDYALAES